MSNIFSKLFGKSKFQPPFQVESSLLKKFPDIINIEWNKNGDLFEAIFYKDNLEYIALLSSEGELIEYRKFLPEGFMPEIIKSELNLKGEIMNVVLCNKGNSITYEVILRDSFLKRYLLHLNETGVILDERVL